jgi:hypothetical protein
MKGQDKQSQNWKRIVGTGIAAVVLGGLFCSICGAAELGCSVHYETAWIAVEVLRHVVLACRQLAPAYLYENSRCCEHLFQIVTSVWPLFWVIAG